MINKKIYEITILITIMFLLIIPLNKALTVTNDHYDINGSEELLKNTYLVSDGLVFKDNSFLSINTPYKIIIKLDNDFKNNKKIIICSKYDQPIKIIYFDEKRNEYEINNKIINNQECINETLKRKNTNYQNVDLNENNNWFNKKILIIKTNNNDNENIKTISITNKTIIVTTIILLISIKVLKQ